MTVDQLLIEIRRVAEAGDPDSPVVRRKLVALVNKPGAAELLIGVLRTGEPFAAEVAALALPHARSELVRHALRAEARRVDGDRNLSFLAALTPEELVAVMKERGGVASQEFVEAAGLLAVNNPTEFVEMLCEGTAVIGLPVIEHVELVRSTFAIRAAALYGPLLDRRLSPEARRRTIGILGRESGQDVKRLLERAQSRATDSADQKALRREQLRQASLTLASEPHAGRHGTAVLTPFDAAGECGLELFEELADGRVLHSIVRVGTRSVLDAVSAPSDADLETSVARAAPNGTPRITLGQARSYLEGFPAARRARVAALVDRLADVPAEPLSGPQPTGTLSAEQSHELLSSPLWEAWRPLRSRLEWTDESLDAMVIEDSAQFPARIEDLLPRAELDVPDLFARRGMARQLSDGLRHQALVMHLAGDDRAPAVAGEAAKVGRRQWGSLMLALVQRERWLQLWTLVHLPADYRNAVRAELRGRIDATQEPWRRVQLLDLAQAAAEGLARVSGERKSTPGLPLIAALDFDLALVLGERAADALLDSDFQRRVRAGQFEIVVEMARTWVDGAPEAAILQIVERMAGGCFGRCPHRCFERVPETEAPDVFEGEAPGTE